MAGALEGRTECQPFRTGGPRDCLASAITEQPRRRAAADHRWFFRSAHHGGGESVPAIARPGARRQTHARDRGRNRKSARAGITDRTIAFVAELVEDVTRF